MAAPAARRAARLFMLGVAPRLVLWLVLGRAAEGAGQPGGPGEPGQGPVVLPRAAGAGLATRPSWAGSASRRSCCSGSALIPFLDRETEGAGVWFGGRGRRAARRRALRVRRSRPSSAIEAFAIRFGWLRDVVSRRSRSSSIILRQSRHGADRRLRGLVALGRCGGPARRALARHRPVHLLPGRLRRPDRRRLALPRARTGTSTGAQRAGRSIEGRDVPRNRDQ